MKKPPATDGLEWLRAIRGELQREIGIKPQQRAAHYQAKEATLRNRQYRRQAEIVSPK